MSLFYPTSDPSDGSFDAGLPSYWNVAWDRPPRYNRSLRPRITARTEFMISQLSPLRLSPQIAPSRRRARMPRPPSIPITQFLTPSPQELQSGVNQQVERTFVLSGRAVLSVDGPISGEAVHTQLSSYWVGHLYDLVTQNFLYGLAFPAEEQSGGLSGADMHRSSDSRDLDDMLEASRTFTSTDSTTRLHFFF